MTILEKKYLEMFDSIGVKHNNSVTRAIHQLTKTQARACISYIYNEIDANNSIGHWDDDGQIFSILLHIKLHFFADYDFISYLLAVDPAKFILYYETKLQVLLKQDILENYHTLSYINKLILH